MRISYYDEEGRPRDAEGNLIMDGGIVPDGGVVRVRMTMMDGQQRAIASGTLADYQQGLADGRADNGQEAYEQRVCNAWRGDGKAPAYQAPIPLSDSAQRQIAASRAHHDNVAAWADHFSAKHGADLAEPDPGGQEAYERRICNQWRATA